MKFPVQLYLLIISIFLFGCSAGRDLPETNDRETDKPSLSLSDTFLPESRRVRGNPTYYSIHFYTLGEMTYQTGDLLTAYGLFNQADFHDPENITIKERILETLLLIAREDPSHYTKIIDLGEDYISRGLYSAEILRFLGLAYFQDGKNEDGLQVMKLALDLDQDPYSYYDYFLYLLRYGNKIEFLYLEKALKGAYNEPELLYSIAQIYEHHNPLRTKEILENAAERFGDQESRNRLIDFYKRYRDWYSLADFVQLHLAQGKEVSEENRVVLLEVLFSMEEYDAIIDNYIHYSDILTKENLEIFFFSAYLSEKYEIVIDTGSKILKMPDITEQRREVFLAYLGEVYALLHDYGKAAEHLKQINDLSLLSSIITTDHEEKEHTGFDAEFLISKLVNKGYDKHKGKFLLGRFYLSRDQKEKGLSLLLELLETENGSDHSTGHHPETHTHTLSDKDDLIKSMAVNFLDFSQTEPAERSLRLIGDPEFCPYAFIGTYYEVNDDDSLAVEYYTKSVENREVPESEVFLSLASLLNQSQKHEKELQLMERAESLYPENPLILNWLGYSLVIHTARYEEAEEYLLKAISLEPDSYFIQDSVAWLYYKLQDYEKALSYMQNIIEDGVEDSIIAYHIGMIYYKLSEKEAAGNYFLKATVLDTDEDYKIKAEKMLEEIETAYE